MYQYCTFPRPHFLYLRASFCRTIDKAPIRQRLTCIMTSSTRLKQCVQHLPFSPFVWDSPRDRLQQSDEQADILTNLEAAQKHLEFVNTDYLHALDTLPASLINGVENNPPPALPTAGSTNMPVTVTVEGEAEPRPPVKSARKKRVPKGVIPGVTPPPDPERWSKKSERTNAFNQSGKKRKTGGGGATQGIADPTGPLSTQSTKTGGSGKGRKKK